MFHIQIPMMQYRRPASDMQKRGKNETQVEESISQMGIDGIISDYGRHYVLLFAVSFLQYQVGL